MTQHEQQLEREIKFARPGLRTVSPLSFWIVLVYAIFNIILGVSFILAVDKIRFSSPLYIVNNVFTYDVWGLLFSAIGVFKIISLAINDWDMTRKSLLIGVSIKAAWAVALIIRIFISSGTIFVTLTWLTLAAVQIFTYIYLLPPSAAAYKQRRSERT